MTHSRTLEKSLEANTEKLTLFRVQDQDGDGPYGSVVATKLTYDWYNHPSISEYGFHPDHEYFFAFPSLEALQKWFYNEMFETLLDDTIATWEIAVLTVSSNACMVTPEQVAFNMNYCATVGSMPLTNVYSRENKTFDETAFDSLIGAAESIEVLDPIHDFEDAA